MILRGLGQSRVVGTNAIQWSTQCYFAMLQAKGALANEVIEGFVAIHGSP